MSIAIPLVLALACASQGGTSGAGGGGGSGAGGGAGSAATPEHRPVALRCEPAGASTGAAGSAAGGASGGAGAGACTTDADCSVDGGAALPWFCLAGTCSQDQCLADENCAAGSVCGCSTQVVGITPHVNGCLPSSCRTDADCPDTRLCSPARGGHCGSPSGYHCHTSADTCRTDADCPSHPSIPAGGPYVYRSCDYALEVGHWQCVAVTPCGG